MVGFVLTIENEKQKFDESVGIIEANYLPFH